MSISTYVRSPHKYDPHEPDEVCRGCGKLILIGDKRTIIDDRVICNKCNPVKDKKIDIDAVIKELKDKGIL